MSEEKEEAKEESLGDTIRRLYNKFTGADQPKKPLGEGPKVGPRDLPMGTGMAAKGAKAIATRKQTLEEKIKEAGG